MYMVEVVRCTRRVEVLVRRRYYENADDVYTATKTSPSEKFLVLKLYRVDREVRVLLKYHLRGRGASKFIKGETENE